MFLIEKLSNYIASKITNILNKDNDFQEVLAYGAFAILQTTWSILLVVVFGVIFDVLFESLLVSFIIAILRKYSGGAHATSPNRCALIGAIITIVLAHFIHILLRTNNLAIIHLIIFFSFTYTLLILYKYCPVDTPNKPITKKDVIKRLRKQSFFFVLLLIIITIILYISFLKSFDIINLKLILIICLGIVWQSFTLTSLGHQIISFMDNLLHNISLLLRRRKI